MAIQNKPRASEGRALRLVFLIQSISLRSRCSGPPKASACSRNGPSASGPRLSLLSITRVNAIAAQGWWWPVIRFGVRWDFTRRSFILSKHPVPSCKRPRVIAGCPATRTPCRPVQRRRQTISPPSRRKTLLRRLGVARRTPAAKRDSVQFDGRFRPRPERADDDFRVRLAAPRFASKVAFARGRVRAGFHRKRKARGGNSPVRTRPSPARRPAG